MTTNLERLFFSDRPRSQTILMSKAAYDIIRQVHLSREEFAVRKAIEGAGERFMLAGLPRTSTSSLAVYPAEKTK